MGNHEEEFRSYFTSPLGYFWKWADQGQVIEWMDKTTVVYRQDLIFLLNNQLRYGWPSLGSVVLTLLACSADWKELRNSIGKLAFIKQVMTSDNCGLKEAHDRMNDLFPVFEETLKLLDRVHALEAEHRTGNKRILLLATLFEKSPKAASGSSCKLLLHDLSEGTLNGLLSDNSPALYTYVFSRDMGYFEYARTAFKTTEELRNKLLTGITELPEPAEPEMEETDTEEHASSDLLDQLEEDPKTFGMTKLTRRLIAALQIPMHARGVSDQSFGGVSDITNRGDFDRLLLSELANEDDTLMARLANNEALFLRREELPSNIDFDRYILVDTTIKLWGIPRIFSIAAALACARKRKPETPLHTFVLGGKEFAAVDLETKQGVLESLSQLDPALHCGESLVAFMEEQPKQTADEYFFITSEEVYASPDFLPALTRVQTGLRYIITVNRTGGMTLYQLTAGHRKEVSAARFDLEELLFAKPAVKKKALSIPQGMELRSAINIPNGPVIFKQERFPLYWPAAKLKLKRERVLESKKHGVFVISNDQRVLQWTAREKGAIELLDYIEAGHYAMVVDDTTLYILVKSNNRFALKLYAIRFEERRVYEHSLKHLLTADIDSVEPGNRCFVIQSQKNVHRLNYVHLELTDITGDAAAQQEARSPHWYYDVMHVKKFINNGYTAIGKVNYIGLSADHQFVIDGRCLELKGNYGNNLQFVAMQKVPSLNYARYMGELHINENNKNVKLTEYVFENGNRVFVDSRGMLHFVSSDPAMHHFSLVYVLEHQVACWSSANVVAGARYFHADEDAELLPEVDFMKNYITPFFNSIPLKWN